MQTGSFTCKSAAQFRISDTITGILLMRNKLVLSNFGLGTVVDAEECAEPEFF